MLIPSIDLLGGRVVQLEQGERLKFVTDDLDGWLMRFAGFPLVQLIDLDAARRTGHNTALVERICRARPCQVGGGIQSIARARDLLDLGARRVIVGSALFDATGVDDANAAAFASAIGAASLMAAVDARAGHVVVHGWKTTLPVAPADAMRRLEPFVGAFLYTHVDTEGTMAGLDLARVAALARVTTRPLVAAGGIRTVEEVDALDRLGIDAVVGMAIYTGRLAIARATSPGTSPSNSP